MPSKDGLSQESLASRLTTRIVGRQVEYYDEIDSTNRRAVALARAGAPAGTVVVANAQTRGKGRLGRQWLAPPGASLLFSVLLRPDLAPMQAQRTTMICALAMVEAIQKTAGLEPGIKWPNDLMLNQCKLGGMLTELGMAAGSLSYVVLGVGVNVNLDPSDLDDVMTPPASLSSALGQPVSRLDLLVAFLTSLEELSLRMAEGWSPHTAWRDHLITLGQVVNVGTGDEVIHGRVEDVDADGALLVRENTGTLRRILVGDVTLRGHITGPGQQGE